MKHDFEKDIDDAVQAAINGSKPARCLAWAQVLTAKRTLPKLRAVMTNDEYTKCRCKIARVVLQLEELDRAFGRVTAY
jgi:hypothetical protein